MRFVRSPVASLVAFATGVACGGLGGQPSDRPPVVQAPNGQSYYLVTKGPYKAYYDGFGRLDYIEYENVTDAGRPSRVVARYDGQKRPHRLEIDLERDGRVDRWEDYDAEGRLTRFAPIGADGKAHRWTVVGPKGEAVRYEYDQRGDGHSDRIEFIEGDHLGRVELDTNGDGKIDRWQEWKSGRLVSEAVDTDGDGKPDRKLTYGENGQVLRVERVSP
jgi:EF hand